ncbi:hypothetical protein ACIBCU_03035 [Streptomyces sp. NPDC051064]|uniref:hypothetical protein n=1 Tax=Streptomyces sp. NPDC051064 TaxID=3365641 RepID=UPI003794995D
MPGTEWAAYHDELAEAFGLRIDAIGPHFGTAALLDAPTDSDDPATLVGAGDRYVRPATTSAASRSATRPRSAPTPWSAAGAAPTRRSRP